MPCSIRSNGPSARVGDPLCQAGVVSSLGPTSRNFAGVTDVAPIEAVLTKGHAVLDRLDKLPLPTVAVIHGYCLGGGLEVALACDFRIATDDASFGFPEVLLGLHPGLGGTVRLPRLINPVQAMTMMLTGKTERARKARSRALGRCRDAGAPCPRCGDVRGHRRDGRGETGPAR